MERVHYRRHRPSQEVLHTYEAPHEEEDGVLVDTLILQGIISGVILVGVMIISILTLPPLAPLQEAIRDALSGPVTPRELMIETRQFGVDVLGITWLE